MHFLLRKQYTHGQERFVIVEALHMWRNVNQLIARLPSHARHVRSSVTVELVARSKWIVGHDWSIFVTVEASSRLTQLAIFVGFGTEPPQQVESPKTEGGIILKAHLKNVINGAD